MSKSEIRRLSYHGITKETIELMEEIRKDPIAFQKLKDKCNWEAMSQYAVLKEWGDPREW